MRALFIGAHPDDIELGCGGALLKLAKMGHEVSAVILTAEAIRGAEERRMQESLEALSLANIPRSRVHFWGERDGVLSADATTVARFREFLKQHRIEPDVVFTHAATDSHGDHRAAHLLCKGAFRQVSFLFYNVVNSGSLNSFAPDLWIDISGEIESKKEMLAKHVSQIEHGRIMWGRLNEYHERYASQVPGDYAEAFEAMIQEGDSDGVQLLSQLNDSSFTRLWRQVIAFHPDSGGRLTIIYGRSVGAFINRHDGDTFNLDIAALCEIQSRLVREFPSGQRSNGLYVRAVEASAYNDECYFEQGDVLLLGGPASNNATLRIFNNIPGLRYTIDYGMPGYHPLWLTDKITDRRHDCSYSVRRDGSRVVEKDYAVLSFLKNPYNPNGFVIGAMGVHGYGTKAAVNVLLGHGEIAPVFEALSRLADPDVAGVQLVIETSDGGLTGRACEETIHFVTREGRLQKAAALLGRPRQRRALARPPVAGGIS